MTSRNPEQTSWRTALLDVLLIIGVLLGLKSLLLNVDALWTYAGPISLIAALAVATWRLRRNRETWASIGLRQPASIRRAISWTLLALFLTMAVGILADGLAVSAIGEADDATRAIDERYQGRFDNLPGNLSVYLFWLAMAWIIGGFTEEILFRGVLFARFERLLRPLPFAAVLAVVLQAVLFGQQHYYYQGFAGWVATGAIGVVSGLLYLRFNRNLWPLVISHGLGNTIGLTLIFLGMMG